jgi:hypothetical protein
MSRFRCVTKNPRAGYARRLALPAVTLAAAGLVLAGCGSSPAGSAGSSPGGSSAGGSAGGSGSAGQGGPSGQSSGGATGAAEFFPVGLGNTWVYTSSDGGTVTNKMIAVQPVASGQKVTMADINGVGHSTSKSTFIFHSDGSIEYPFSQLGNKEVSIKASGVLWPPASALASGVPHRSTLHITFSLNGQHQPMTSHVTVQGGGSASVSVPAGTYHTQIVNMTMAMTYAHIPIKIEVRTWIADGVGPVKSEALSFEGGKSQIVSVEKLKSFTKG